MRNLANLRQLLVDGMWNDEAGKPGVCLWCGDRRDMPEGKLRSLLFAWHKGSWYGSDIDEARTNGQSVLKLSPLQAMDYLSKPLPVGLLQLDWSPRLQTLKEMAESIRILLLNGWFIPDWELWSEEQRHWKAAFPEAMQDQAERWLDLLEAAAEEGDGGAKQWLGAAVEEWIAENGVVGNAWADIGRSAGESVVRHKSVDEEEWLIAIGLEKDVLPFRVALQLGEPGHGHGWTLRPAIQDQNGGPWMPIAWNGGEAALIAESEEGEQLPEAWRELLPGKLMKETVKWLAVLSGLAEESGFGEGLGEPLLRHELTEDEAWHLLQHGSVALLEAGCPVLLPAWWEAVRSRKLKLRAKLKSSVGSAAQPMFGLNQIMQFDWKLALGDVNLTEAEFMEMAKQNRKLFRVGDEWVHLDPQDAEKIKTWLNRAGKRKGLTFRDVLEMHLRGESVAELDDDPESDLRAEVELNQHLEAWLNQLQHISHIPQANVPITFKGELRPYQLEGVSWLLFLRRFGLGGVLADDMGLGKTIQFMAYLLCIKHEELGVDGPSLLICPTSVIGNWEKELARFAPELDVMLHYGSRRLKGEELWEAAARKDLVITSYSLAQLDEEELAGVSWNVLCLDEAQNIKNVYTKQSRAIRQLEARHRIALTGTPMENRLTELWSIYDFINPGYLGSLPDFRRAVVAPIEKNRDEALISGLQRWVKPFMLRRVKKDPAIQLSLPDKIETKSYMTLTTEQGTLYENLVSDLMEKLDTLDAMSRRGLILATLTKLKQLCDHPSLLLNDNANKEWDPERSGKTARLLEMCEEIAAEGERCLIFTQYVDMGKQIQLLLKNRLGIEVPYLHGGVPKQKRDEMISRFQSEEVPGCAFVLSLKAGGTGLNLTAANHVFHFDRWWNPAVENQATDRAFRIGQTRQVQVHKFITLGTLEEKIDEMIDSKQSLNDQVVSQSDQWITELSTDELRELFALRDGWMKE
jgi:superfamily II DNA or RNA helicase